MNYTKLIGCLFLCFLFVGTNAQSDGKEEVFVIVEEMPRFPGCEEETDKELRKECAFKKLQYYILGELKYPSEARKKGIEGKVMAQFVVGKNGEIYDIEIVKDIGHGCGAEVIRVLRSMNDMPEQWIPGKQRGKKVNVRYTIPVQFSV